MEILFITMVSYLPLMISTYIYPRLIHAITDSFDGHLC